MYYVALGDSITISTYPEFDSGNARTGAGDLLVDRLFEEDRIKDALNLSVDGAQIDDVLTKQLPVAAQFAGKRPVVISLTMGGNDISYRLFSMKAGIHEARYQKMIEETMIRYAAGIAGIASMFSRAHIIVNTLYDPTDGMGRLPENCGSWAKIAPWYSRGRRDLGGFIRKWAPTCQAIPLHVVDVFEMFDGKGMKIKNRDGYYFDHFLIEPGAVGALAIADAWYDTFRSITKHQEGNDDRSTGSRQAGSRLR